MTRVTIKLMKPNDEDSAYEAELLRGEIDDKTTDNKVSTLCACSAKVAFVLTAISVEGGQPRKAASTPQ